jgi:hypothetical protein
VDLLLSVVIGIGIGAAIVYFILKPKLVQHEQALKQTRKMLDEREKAFDARLQAAVKSLQAEYQQQLDLKMEELHQHYEASVPAADGLDESQTDSIAESPITEDSLVERQPGLPSSNPQPPKSTTPLTATEYEAMSVPVVAAEPNSPTVTSTVDRPLVPRYVASSHQIAKTIVAWGYSGEIQHIPLLIGYAYNSDGHLRGLAASAVGQIAAAQPMRVELQRAIPILEKLIRDPDSSVRRAAVEALGKFSSEKVILPLKLALRDFDPDVVKSASEAIANFKRYRVSRLAKATTPKLKQLNRR